MGREKFNARARSIFISMMFVVLLTWAGIHFFKGATLYINLINNNKYIWAGIIEFLPIIILILIIFVWCDKLKTACIISSIVILLVLSVSLTMKMSNIILPRLYYCFQNPYNNKYFSKLSWASGKTDDFLNIRGLMVSDLLNNYLKKGMSRKVIIDLLGEPDYEKTGSYHYKLGVYSGIIDHDYLRISFNEDGNMTSFKLYQS